MTKTLSSGKAAALPLRLKNIALRAGAKANGRVLCSGLDLTIASGERWVLLGPNGAGKSTLLMTIAGLIPPDAGSITLGDYSLAAWQNEALAKMRAWCPQFWLDPFPVSAWETVACSIYATRPELESERVQQIAREWLGKFDANHLADTDVRTLSGGERQRVALATACAQGAPLLLLDEPTSHLDWSHQAVLQDLLKRWSQDDGIVLAAVHDLNLAWTLATHALLLDGCGGARWGTREEVLTADALATAYGVPVSILEDGAARWFRIDLESQK